MGKGGEGFLWEDLSESDSDDDEPEEKGSENVKGAVPRWVGGYSNRHFKLRRIFICICIQQFVVKLHFFKCIRIEIEMTYPRACVQQDARADRCCGGGARAHV